MNLKGKFILIVTLFCSFSAFSQSGADVLKQMVTTINQMNTIMVKVDGLERIKGTNVKTSGFFKVLYKPFKVYHKQVLPVKDLEVLYVEGSNDNKALINPNAFPYVNVSLSPYSSTMRDGFHLTLYESGFKYFGSLINNLLTKYSKDLDKLVSNKGNVTVNGVKTLQIEVQLSEYKYSKYLVKKGETLTSIAKKLFLSDYMLLEKNKLGFYDKVKEDDIILVPNEYAKKIVLFIDIQNNIPVKIVVYDEVGLYEQYEFSIISINPSFQSDEFTEKFKDYHF